MKALNILTNVSAALLLFVAAIMKAHQLLTTIIPTIVEIMDKYSGFELLIRIFDSREIMLFHIPFEIGLGIWLISGLFRKAAHFAVFLTFAMFIFITAYKAINGDTDCGCFGVFRVNPWVTLTVIDIPMFFMFAVFWPVGCKLLPPPWPKPIHFFSIAVPSVIMLVGITVFMFTAEPVKPVPLEDSGVVWDKIKHIDIADKINTGMWVVLLYHEDCPNCKEAIPEYQKIAPDFQDSINFAFVEIPPYSKKEDSIISSDTISVVGKLDKSQDWLIQTPRVVLIVDSVVVKSWQINAPSIDEILQAID